MNPFFKISIGAAIILLLGLAALFMGSFPGSISSAEKKIQKQTQTALGVEASEWASLTIDGQKAYLTGAAPNEDARNDVIERITTAIGPGGILFGGVTTVDVSALIVEPPLPPVTEVIDAEPPEQNETITPALAEPAPSSSSSAAAEATKTDDEENAEPERPVSAATCLSTLRDTVANHRIGFSSASADIGNEGRTYLREIAEQLNSCPQAALRITGYTDASGNARRNQQLSGYRADAVRTFLISIGAPANAISSAGAGSADPLVSNATPEGRRQNRRIEIEVIRRDG